MLEVRNWKSEVRSQKSEVRSQKLEVKGQKILVVIRCQVIPGNAGSGTGLAIRFYVC